MKPASHIVAVVSVMLLAATVHVAHPTGAAAGVAQETESGCDGGPPTTVLYINGINTKEGGAFQSSEELRDFVGSRIGEPRVASDVEYGYLYNPTAGLVLDTIEVLQQKLEELVDAGILTAKQLADFGTKLAGVALESAVTSTRMVARLVATLPNSFVEDAAQDIGEIAAQLPDLFTTIQGQQNRLNAELAETFSDSLLTDPATRATQSRMARGARDAAQDGRRVVLVGHSQGNLFASAVVEEIGDADIDLRVVHVAPPNHELHGPYTLIDTDLVIGALAATTGALNKPPPPNAHADPNGLNHGFGDAYLAGEESAPLIEDHLAADVGHCLAVGLAAGREPEVAPEEVADCETTLDGPCRSYDSAAALLADMDGTYCSDPNDDVTAASLSVEGGVTFQGPNDFGSCHSPTASIFPDIYVSVAPAVEPSAYTALLTYYAGRSRCRLLDYSDVDQLPDNFHSLFGHSIVVTGQNYYVMYTPQGAITREHLKLMLLASYRVGGRMIFPSDVCGRA